MTISEVSRLRHYVDEQTDEIYGDAFLSDVIDESVDLFAAAAEIWRMKAARFAALVDTAEAGASRKMGQLKDNALSMAKSFDDRSGSAESPVSTFAVTRAIERA